MVKELAKVLKYQCYPNSLDNDLLGRKMRTHVFVDMQR